MDRAIRICFFFNAQRHQLLHGMATAVQLARRDDVEVHVASPCATHIAYARRLTDRLGGAPIHFSTNGAEPTTVAREGAEEPIPPKLLTLARYARWLNGFDAIALPERTSTLLRAFGTTAPRLIHLDHGAGDRAAGFDRRIRLFDLVLMAGEKHRERLQREHLIRPGGYAVVGYPKFEAADAIRDPGFDPFGNGRPVVLYNPHFSKLGSWFELGPAVLSAFAAQDRYNLIVAPHVRMLGDRRQRARWDEAVAPFANCPHILLDPGSERSIDMTYTALADVYLGDVSSQVYEFLRDPKPCLFLNPHGVDWAADENYAHWHFGPVLRAADTLVDDVGRACATHGQYSARQVEGFTRTFATSPIAPSVRAADAIEAFLRADAVQRSSRRRSRPSLQVGVRAAAVLMALGIG